MIEVLNLGAGVQSSTLLRMSLDGELPPLRWAIFADVGWEPDHVYRWLDVLRGWCDGSDTELIIVQKGDLKEDAMQGIAAGTRWASIPVHLLHEDGTTGILRRQCTYEYKIRPIEKFLRENRNGENVRQWFGISFDERQRMRKPNNKWSQFYYPLVEARYGRTWCLEYMSDKGFEPPRSACIGCPYHHDSYWRDLKRNYPAEFEDACQFDDSLRVCGIHNVRSKAFLHRSCQPLRDIDFRNDYDRGQLPLFGDECSGMCGV